MRVFDSTGLKMLAAATMTLAAGMAMPMHHHGKMVRPGMRSMRHHAAKGDDRYGMK